MRISLLFLPVILAAQAVPPGAAPSGPSGTGSALVTDEQKTVYAIGLSIYRSVASLDLSPSELDLIKQALSDAAAGKPALDLNEWQAKISPFAQSRSARMAEREKAAAKAYLAKAAAGPGAVKTDSGLIYTELQPGTGASPRATDTVKVNYRGALIDGTEFDSSYKRNQPAQFPLSGVIRCWTEGVQMMKTGGKARLVCPSDLAYGDNGRPPVIPGGATLVFEVELLEVAGN
jgi:FKBP-type peptidyl-prolyl cis-trans isomerase FkpA